MKYYFFDDDIIKFTENAEVITGKVAKICTNASWLDQYAYSADSGIPEWEKRISILYPYVLYEDKKYKMWYHAWKTKETELGLIDRNNSQNVNLSNFENIAKGQIYKGDHILCYMESVDGINWERPQLGEFFYKKKTGEIVGTNIVFAGSHGQGVSKNTHPDAGKTEPKFLLAGRCEDDENYGVVVAESSDGIHWSAPKLVKKGNKDTREVWADTHNQIFWSPEAMEYVIITRSFEGDCRVVTRMGKDGKCSTVITGTEDAQPYSVPIWRISDGYYVGIVSVADFDKNSPGYQRVHTGLVWSKDTKNWKYISSAPFIDNDAEFFFERGNDYGMIYSSAPVLTENDVKFFYAALPELHYFSFSEIPENIKEQMEKTMPKAMEEQAITRSTTLKIANIGKDRFGGVYASRGSVITNALKVEEDALTLTADVNPGGEIKITVGGMPEFEKNIRENCTNCRIFDLKDLRGEEISLQFEICDAAIYAMNL